VVEHSNAISLPEIRDQEDSNNFPKTKPEPDIMGGVAEIAGEAAE
jgi:hypothetical protein